MSLRIYRRSDPRWLPHRRRANGMYELNERGHGSKRNLKKYAHSVTSLEDVVRLLRTGRYVLRMSVGGNTSPSNLIEPDEIEIDWASEKEIGAES